MLLIERLGFCYVLLFFLPDFAGTVFALIAKDAACDKLVTLKHHIASPFHAGAQTGKVHTLTMCYPANIGRT